MYLPVSALVRDEADVDVRGGRSGDDTRDRARAEVDHCAVVCGAVTCHPVGFSGYTCHAGNQTTRTITTTTRGMYAAVTPSTIIMATDATARVKSLSGGLILVTVILGGWR